MCENTFWSVTLLCSLHLLSGVGKTKVWLGSSILIFAVSILHFANTLWFRLVAASHHAAICSLSSWWDEGEKWKQNRTHGLGYTLCNKTKKKKKKENRNKNVMHGMQQPCAYFRLAVLALPWPLSRANMAMAFPCRGTKLSLVPGALPSLSHNKNISASAETTTLLFPSTFSLCSNSLSTTFPYKHWVCSKFAFPCAKTLK